MDVHEIVTKISVSEILAVSNTLYSLPSDASANFCCINDGLGVG